MSSDQYLKGKLALVTGSGKPNGIGFAIARALAQHGADIVVHYNSSKDTAEQCVKTLQQMRIQAVALQADASKASFGADLVHDTLKAFPDRSIDIIVNNAAVAAFSESASSSPLETFDSIFHPNVRSPFALIQAAVPHLAAPGARIINIGSLAGQQGSTYGPFYAAAKLAIQSLSRSFAEELGAKGITVNTVAPGPITTDMVPPEDHPVIAKCRADQYVKRNGTPEEVAIAVLLFAHPNASFITGQSLAVDGGIHW